MCVPVCACACVHVRARALDGTMPAVRACVRARARALDVRGSPHAYAHIETDGHWLLQSGRFESPRRRRLWCGPRGRRRQGLPPPGREASPTGI